MFGVCGFCLDFVCACNPWHLDSSSSSSVSEEEEEEARTKTPIEENDSDDDDGEIDVHLERSFEPYTEHRLPADFDARHSLLANFRTRRRLLTDPLEPAGIARLSTAGARFLSSELSRKMLDEARRLLHCVGEKARDAREDLARAMEKYELAISSQSNLAERELLIAEYQSKKHELGVEAREDAEVAESYLAVAHSNVHSLRERVNAYQIALIHTNEPDENRRLLVEYCAFCEVYR